MSKRSARTEETRRRIISAAIDCYCEKGVQGASLDLIAARAGSTKPTLYAHFGSKDQLFDAVLSHLIKTHCSSPWPPFDPARSVKAQLLELFIDHIDECLAPANKQLTRAIIVEAIHREAENLCGFEEIDESPLELWLKSAMEAGALRSGDAKALAENLWGLVKGRVFWPAVLGLQTLPKQQRDQVLDEVLALFVRAEQPEPTL